MIWIMLNFEQNKENSFCQFVKKIWENLNKCY